MPVLRVPLAVVLAALLAGCAEGFDVEPPPLREAALLPVVHVAGTLVPSGGGNGSAQDGQAACPQAFRYGFDPETRALRRWADPGLDVGSRHVGVLVFAVDLRDVGCENPYGLQALERDGTPQMVSPNLSIPLPVEVREDRIVVADRTYPEGAAAAVPVDADGVVGTLLLTHLGLWRMETVPEKTPLAGDHPLWEARARPEEQAFHVVTLAGRLHEDPPQTYTHACGRPLYTFQVDPVRHEVRRLEGHHEDLDEADLVLLDQSALEPPAPCATAQLLAVVGDPLHLRLGQFPETTAAPTFPVAAHPFLLRVDGEALPTGGTVAWEVSFPAGGRTYSGTLTLTYLGVWTRHDVRTVDSEDEVFGETDGETGAPDAPA